MLVNYKKNNVLTVERGKGVPKLVLVPGINVISDDDWKKVEETLSLHIKKGSVVPIYKVSKKGDKEVKEPCTPDEIPNNQLGDVVNEIQSEAQADLFVEVSTKESIRAMAMNRKLEIAEELKNRGR